MSDFTDVNVSSLSVNGATIQPAVGSPWARHWFVDGNAGSNDYSGTKASEPFLTMTKAFTKIRSGDVIHLRGNIREQLTTPAGVFDVTIIGPSTVTRHPDAHAAHSTNGGYSSCRWNAPASPTASTPLCTVSQQGWRFINILFTGDEDDNVSCVRLFRDAGSGDAEDDASHAQFYNCRFQGGLYGIEDHGGCANVVINGCTFMLFSVSDNAAIKSTTGAGVGTLWGWQIENCRFMANHTDILVALSGGYIKGCHFVHDALGVTNTRAIVNTGTKLLVAQNYMYCDSAAAGVINARFVPGTGDMFMDNYFSDKAEYAEPAE